MSASVSLFRVWLYGTGVFVAGTAALCIALSIAIAGPPTDEELASMRVIADAGLREMGQAAQKAGTEACERLPADLGALLLCPEDEPVETVAAPEPPRPTALSTPEQPLAAPVQIAAAAPVATSPDLLGAERAERPRSPAHARGATARRPAAHPARSAPPRHSARRQQTPIVTHNAPAIEPLHASDEVQLIETPSRALELREEEQPVEKEPPYWSDVEDDPYAEPDEYTEPEPDDYYETPPDDDWLPRQWR